MIRYPLLLSSVHLHPQPVIPIAILRAGRTANTWGVLEPSCPDVVLPLTSATDLGLSWDLTSSLPRALITGPLVLEIVVGDDTLAWPVERVRFEDLVEAKLGWRGYLEYFNISLYYVREVFEITQAKPLPPMP